MSGPTNVGTADGTALRSTLRQELLRLAKREDDIAACEAATIPYWAPSPATILAHRLAASALRESADRMVDGHAAAIV
jgi:hypothetical protein